MTQVNSWRSLSSFLELSWTEAVDQHQIVCDLQLEKLLVRLLEPVGYLFRGQTAVNVGEGKGESFHKEIIKVIGVGLCGRFIRSDRVVGLYRIIFTMF